MADDTYNRLLWQSLLSDRPETSLNAPDTLSEPQLNPQANLYEPHVPLTGGVARERLSQDVWQTLGALRHGLSPRSAGVDVLAPTPPERPAMSGEVRPAPWYADPIEVGSQVMAPRLLPYARGVGEMFAGRELGAGGRLSLLKGEAGNLGPVPVHPETGAPLPESVARDASGKLQKYYHGTRETFPDFDLAYSNPSDWARGVFTSSVPEYGEGYALGNWPQRSRDAYFLMRNAQDDATYYGRLAAEERDPQKAARYHEQAWGYNAMARQEYETLQDLMARDPERHQGSQLRAVYHDVRKPLEMDSPADVSLVRGLQEAYDTAGRTMPAAPEGGWTNREVNNTYRRLHGVDAAQAWLQAHGYDAYHEYAYSQSLHRHHEVMTPFSVEQVYPAAHVEALPGFTR